MDSKVKAWTEAGTFGRFLSNNEKAENGFRRSAVYDLHGFPVSKAWPDVHREV